MEYFKLLNLNREPFSNSPDPMFFYKSRVHAECLHQIEIALRLKRGLNILIGEVGTGKTTIIRRLIQNLSEDNGKVETHLILDPDFPSARAFLFGLNRLFGAKRIPKNASEHYLKERLKNYLFRRGVDEEVNVVLIIDEGQKISPPIIEVLRELLNYETNQNKLLQIVIAAQNEFVQTLEEHHNFGDRANLLLKLAPLSFKETRDMVRFRLSCAGQESLAAHIFTWPALLAVHLASKGYPRRIVNLCYNSLLTMLVQNRARVGWSVVRATDRRIFPKTRGILRPVILAGLLFALAAFALTNPELTGYNLKWLAGGSHPESRLSAAVALKADAPKRAAEPGPKAPAKRQAAKPRPAGKAAALKGKVPYPDVLGYVVIVKDEYITKLVLRIYGSKGTHILSLIKKINPEIKNLDVVSPGQRIYMPVVPHRSFEAGRYKLKVAGFRNLDEAYRFFRVYKDQPIRILPVWDGDAGLRFPVVTKRSFPSPERVLAYAESLPKDLAQHAEVLGDLPKGAVMITDVR